jgi:hypothetical protein
MGATPHPNCGEQGSGAEFAWHPSAQIADAWLVHLVDFANDIGELSISCQVEVKASKLAYEMLNLYSTPHASNTHGNLYIIRDLWKPSSRVAGFPLDLHLEYLYHLSYTLRNIRVNGGPLGHAV